MWQIVEAMVRWLAPILSFTAEEIWRLMPGPRAESVFHSTWADLPALPAEAAPVDWARLLQVRGAVLRELERLRVAGAIGAPLDAIVEIYAGPAMRAALDQLGEELRFVLITSGARVHAADARPEAAVSADAEGETGVWLQVHASNAAKCVRCWHKREDVGRVVAHPELCERCASNLDGAGEVRRYA
jgi:isoleucyl-tRNA synthetase